MPIRLPFLATGAAACAVAGLLCLPQAAGAATGPQVTGLTQNDRLVTFSAGDPSVVSKGIKITGLTGELLGIDYRPLDGRLYGVVRDPITGAGSLVAIDPATGVVTVVAALSNAAGAVVLSGTNFGVDFNPAADALRITSDSGQDLRVCRPCARPDRPASRSSTAPCSSPRSPGTSLRPSSGPRT